MSFRGKKITEETRRAQEKSLPRAGSGHEKKEHGERPRKKSPFSGERRPGSESFAGRFKGGRTEVPTQPRTANAAPKDMARRTPEEAPDITVRSGDRNEDASFLPGLKPVLEHLETSPRNVEAVYLRAGKGGPAIQRILELCAEAGIRFVFSDAVALDRMCAGNHQGVVARLSAVPGATLEEVLEAGNAAPLPLILALDRVQDPGNLGTLARTLYAMGGAGLIVPKHNSAHIGNAAARSSAGALARLPVARVANLSRALEQAEALGYTIYAAGKTDNAFDVFETPLRLPAVLVLGNEEQGVRPGVTKRCSETLFIPMARDFDSLNVAQAGASFTACFSRAARK